MATWKKYAKEDDVPLKTLWAAKGTIVAASAANTPVGVAVGSDGQLIVADAASAGGIKWQTGATPAAHATTHKSGGSDTIKLNEFTTPDGAVAFNGQQATNLVIHNVANAAALAALTAVVGKIAFQVDTLELYVCTAV